MKGLVKRAMSLMLVLVLVLGTCITASASGDGNTTLIKRAETVAGYTQVSSDSTAAFTLKVKRTDDEFNMYQLTKVTWETASPGVTNVKVEWIDEVQTFIDSSSEFKDATFTSSKGGTKKIYETPENLGEAEDTTSTGQYTADSKVNETYVIELLKAIRKDDALMNTLKTSYKVGYHGDPYDSSTNPATPDEGNSVYVAADSATGEPGKADVVASYQSDDFQYSYSVDNMPVGLCFVDVTSGVRTYQPVLLDLMPVQVGPTGNWYVKNSQEYSLKYEDAGIKKTINGNSYDIVRDGEIVTFDIEVEVPMYQKKTDNNYEFSLFNVYDEMTQGFTLLPSSAVITIYDANGNAYTPTASLTNNTNGSVTVKDSAANSVYEATLADNAYVYYSTTDDKDVFYGTPTGTSGTVQFWGEINGELIALGSYTETTASYTAVINSYNNKLGTGATKLTYTGSNISKRDYTKSILYTKFDYTKLMDTITVDSNNFKPDHIKITYDALVNDKSYVGEDTNLNDVYLKYIGDSAGNQYVSQDEVKAWTYAANIVKVDGDTYKTTQATDSNGDPITDADGNPVYVDPTYLAGAVFDLYRLDVTYCGGVSATTEPAQNDYSTYNFFDDSYGIADYAESRKAWIGDSADNYSKGLLYKAVCNYYNSNASLSESEKSTNITNTISSIDTATGDYSTLDKFTNKYGAYESNKAIFNSYVFPKITTGMTYQYIPVKVTSCDKCATEHYHVQAYAVFNNGITSTADADGITVTGLDPDTYLLVETTAPSGYHQLSSALKFEIKQYNTSEASAAGDSYKGFIDDENNNVTDGIYDIVVQNFKGLVLPSTGGIGTMIFTVIGILIMTGAIAIILVRSKKRKNEEIL